MISRLPGPDRDLTAGDLDRIWRENVRPDVLSSHSPEPDDPLLVLLGGRPGAGKTAGMHHALGLHPGHDLTPLIGDDLRAHHPQYRALLASDDTAMTAVTAGAMPAWIRRCLDYARSQRYILLVEGTFRSPQTTMGTAREFADAGYRVHLIAMAVPPSVSRLGTLIRYYGARAAGEPARWTRPGMTERCSRSAPPARTPPSPASAS